jgi:carbamoyltransferase
MLLVAPVCSARRIGEGASGEAGGFEKLKVCRSEIPAATHVDFSARIQTVDEKRHGLYHRLLKSFERRTGCPVLVNTSFNVRGEPVVCTPEDAYRCFRATGLDVLVLERFVLLKEEQVAIDEAEPAGTHLARFAPD